MKRTFSALLLASVLAVGGAEVIRDFQQNPLPVRLQAGGERGQLLESVVQESRTFARVSRSGGKPAYAELFFDSPREFPAFLTLDVRCNLRSTPDGNVRAVGFRLADSRGEVFQALLPVNDPAFAYRCLRPEDFTESWGRNRDGKMDFPVRLIGISLLYASDEAGSVELSTLEYHLRPAPDTALQPLPPLESSGGRTVETLPLARFGRAGCWQLYQEGNATLTTGEDVHRLQGEGRRFVLEERAARLLRLEPFERARLALESASGSGRIFLTFRSSDRKEEFKTEARRYVSGDQTVEFDLAGMASLTAPVYPALLTVEPDLPQSSLTLKKLELQRRTAPLRAIQPSLSEAIHETGNPFFLQLQNNGNRAETFICSGDVTGERGAAKPFRYDVTLAPGEIGRFQLPGAFSEPAFGRCRYRLAADGDSISGELTWAAVTPVRGDRTGTFRFGVCSHTHTWSEADQEKEARAVKLSGADMIRTGSEWMTLQPEPELWRWETLDRLVERFGNDNIELLLQLSFTPRWAAPEASRDNWRHWSRSMPDLKAWSDYVTATVTRYRGKIRFFEVWNEPDLPAFARFEAEDFVKLQTSAYRAAKAANPDAVVLTGGFATLSGNYGPRPGEFHETVLREGRGCYDCHSYHEHGSFANYAAIIGRKFLPLREKLQVNVPWMASETAVSSINGTELRQAETLYKKILFAWSRGAIGYLWYDLRNDGVDPKNGEHHYGLLHLTIHPNPHFRFSGNWRTTTAMRLLSRSSQSATTATRCFSVRRRSCCWRHGARKTPGAPVRFCSGFPPER